MAGLRPMFRSAAFTTGYPDDVQCQVAIKGGCSALTKFLRRDSVYLLCPWHHRVQMLWVGCGLYLWWGIGGLALMAKGEDNNPFSSHQGNGICNYKGLLTILSWERALLGGITLAWHLLAVIVSIFRKTANRHIAPGDDPDSQSVTCSLSEVVPATSSERYSSATDYLSDPFLQDSPSTSPRGRERFVTASDSEFSLSMSSLDSDLAERRARENIFHKLKHQIHSAILHEKLIDMRVPAHVRHTPQSTSLKHFPIVAGALFVSRTLCCGGCSSRRIRDL